MNDIQINVGTTTDQGERLGDNVIDGTLCMSSVDIQFLYRNRAPLSRIIVFALKDWAEVAKSDSRLLLRERKNALVKNVERKNHAQEETASYRLYIDVCRGLDSDSSQRFGV